MYKYDIALSYEGESEKLVQEVADYLISEKLRVFFAPYYQRQMVSQNLKSELFQIYQNESLIKVLFVTKKYQQSQYTQIEKRRAVSSTINENRRLMIVNFLGENLPEDLKKFVYLNGNIPTDEIADFIMARVKELKNNRSSEAEQDITDSGSKYKNVNFVENSKDVVFGNTVNIGNITIN